MGRTKNKIERKAISDESGIPINRLLELSLEKSLESIKLEIK
ncbi:hypothetical protein [Fusobacterium ulcerans]|nr:hypothetical protein [Fusobacterium ulcerans]